MSPRSATRAAATLLLVVSAALTRVSSPAQTPPAPTLKVYSRETIVDVTVTDAKGNPVHNLSQSDFTLLEDGKPMAPSSFTEHRTDQPQPTPATLTDQQLPPNTFTNSSPVPPSASPLTVLLLDDLNTPLQTQQAVVMRMLELIAKLPPGTRMAVMRLTSRLSIIQAFTADRELLKAAINSKENMPQAAPMEDRGQDPAHDDSPACIQEIEGMASRGQYTITAMQQLARYLGGMPGRKNLIWFGGSFPPKYGCSDQYGQDDYDLTDALNLATDQLARAHVAIDPVDSRGLRTDNNTNPKLREEHYAMDLQADQTGGHAIYASNDLAGAATEDIDRGSNFYTLTYTPTNQTLDTRFRTITVKVSQPGLHLTYRNGYYAVDPTIDAKGKKIDALTPMQAAMMRGALDATQVLFRVKVVPSPTTDATSSPLNQPDPKQMHPPFRHYSVSFLIDMHGIDFAPSADSNFRGSFEYGVRVYNADGDAIVNSASKTVSPVLIPPVYKSMLNGGANAHLDIDVPATGDFFLRIAVHDLVSNRVGSVEIPTASLNSSPTPAGK